MKKILVILSLFTFFSVWAQEGHRDPFESILPKEEIDEDIDRPRRIVEEEIRLPELVAVQGVLWGTLNPQAVIGGKVYSVGDKIEGVDAVIVRIQENVVFISYAGRIFRETVRKREGR